MPLPCVILAGGLATRMRPLTSRLPKSLLVVAGSPFLDVQLGWLQSQGIERVVLSTGHLGDAIESHVREHGPYGMTVDIVDDGPELLGTGGALRRVVDSGMVDDGFFVLNGDSYLTVSMSDVEQVFRSGSRPALMTVIRNRDRWDTSNAVFDQGRVVLYDKRPERRTAAMEWIDYGLVAVRTGAIADAVAPSTPADLADLMHDLSVRGDLGGFEVTERFFEIGSPSGLRELERHLTAGLDLPGGTLTSRDW